MIDFVGVAAPWIKMYTCTCIYMYNYMYMTRVYQYWCAVGTSVNSMSVCGVPEIESCDGVLTLHP